MAGVAYFRARTLLREQAISQSENLLSNQLKIVNGQISAKQEMLEKHLASSAFSTTIELSLHANPQSVEFRDIRKSFVNEIQSTNMDEGRPIFDQFFLVDKDGVIKIASNAEWQAKTLDTSIFEDTDGSVSYALFGLSPIYQNELILVTSVTYKTERGSILGTIVGITEKENLQQLIQPLNGLSPFASTYFILSDNQFIGSDPVTGEFNKVPASTTQNELIASLTKLIENGGDKPVALDVTSPSGEASLAQLQWFPGMQSGIVLEISNEKIYGQIASLAPFTIILALVTLGRNWSGFDVWNQTSYPSLAIVIRDHKKICRRGLEPARRSAKQ